MSDADIVKRALTSSYSDEYPDITERGEEALAALGRMEDEIEELREALSTSEQKNGEVVLALTNEIRQLRAIRH